MKKYKHYLFDWGDTLMVDFSEEEGPMYQWPKVAAVQGAEKLLKELSPLANCYIATNAKASSEEDIRKALKRVGLDQYIKGIFCFGSIGFEKPSTEFFHYIQERLGIPKSDIVMVGDNLKKDVQGALDFGFDAIWLNSKKQKVPEGIVAIETLAQLF